MKDCSKYGFKVSRSNPHRQIAGLQKLLTANNPLRSEGATGSYKTLSGDLRCFKTDLTKC